MKRIIIALLSLLMPKYGRYTLIIWANRIKKAFLRNPKKKFLFILPPPYCGSTLLNE